MSLEKCLAEIEVYSTEIKDRGNNRITNRDYIGYLDGIVKEASLVEDSYFRARKAIKKGDKKLGNAYVGNFAVAAKNLADNLNRFMQAMYSKNYIEDIELKDLKVNLQGSPISINGTSLYKEFAKVHDWSQNSVLNKVRNMKAHGGGHNLLHCDSNSSSRYLIKAEGFQGDSLEWLENYASNYLGLVSTCLKSISVNEKKKLDSKSKVATYDILKNRIGHFANRHKGLATGLVSTIAVASLMSGIVGKSLWDEYSKEIRTEQAFHSFTNVRGINHEEMALSYGASADFFSELAFGMNAKSFYALDDTTRRNLINQRVDGNHFLLDNFDQIMADNKTLMNKKNKISEKFSAALNDFQSRIPDFGN